jgi:hypothetical protein
MLALRGGSAEARRRSDRITTTAITFALLGAISGTMSTAGITPFAPPNDFALLVMFVLPGFAFGIVIGCALASTAGYRESVFQRGSCSRRLVISPPRYA